MENLEHLVPLFECPDSNMEEIFRFRWMAYSTHLFKRANGRFIVTEFSTKVSHSGVDGTVSCPAWHHISEGRWIADRTYMRDYLSFWLTAEAAPRLYSFPLAESFYRYFLVTGDKQLAAELFDGMTMSIREDTARDVLSVKLVAEDDAKRNAVVHIVGEGFAGDAADQKRKQKAAAKRAAQQPMRREKTPDPNDLCPCGSGKKYKKCCALRRAQGAPDKES